MFGVIESIRGFAGDYFAKKKKKKTTYKSALTRGKHQVYNLCIAVC